MKHAPKTDIAVLMLFFNRPETLQLVFNEVRQARPSRLLLYQDGPRTDADVAGINACRSIVADDNIDWECDVRRNYLDHNQGCDPSGFRSHKWAFSIADKVIILEDDVVPAQSFFPFCKELLDRYEHDERITMIAGFNTDEVTPDVPDDYFFTTHCSIWGWASWRRVANQWDASYGFMHDGYATHLMAALAKRRGYRHSMMRMFADHSQSGKEYFETIDWANMLLSSGLCIMPTRNMVSNVGLTADSTHYATELRTMPRRLRRLFTMPRYELTQPLRHPKYVIENVEFLERCYKALGWNHPWVKVGRSIEELLLNLRYGNFAVIGRAAMRRLRILTGRETFK